MIDDRMVRRELHAILPQIEGTPLADRAVEFVAGKANRWHQKSASKAESLAFAVDNAMTAALCYDRLWAPPSDSLGIPEEIVFRDAGVASLRWTLAHLLEEEWLQANFPVGDGYGPLASSEARALGDDPDREMIDRICLTGFGTVLTDEDHGNVRMPTPLRNVIRNYSSLLSEAEGMRVMPVYPSHDECERDFALRSPTNPESGIEIVMATLKDLQVVDESALSWEQVLEFRSDREARRKYRRLLHWLDADFRDESKQFVIDEIEDRLDDYHWALERHGVKSVAGVVSEVLSGSYFAGAGAAGAAVAGFTGNPVFGMLAAGGLVLSRAVVSVAGKRIERADIVHDHRELAWIHDVGSALGSG
jgi:hypothetical protein